MTVCAYAITNSRRVPGVAGASLRAIRVGPLSAIVSDSRRRPAATAMNLRRYHRIQAAIAGQVPAALPARFGTCMEEEELAFILRTRLTTFTDALRHVRHRVQMTVRVPAVPTGRRGTIPEARQPGRPKSGTEYLRHRAADAAAAHDVPGFEPVRSAVSKWVADERVATQAGVVSIYHLVPRRSAAAYARATVDAARAAGLRVVLSGPFPPYAFSVL